MGSSLSMIITEDSGVLILVIATLSEGLWETVRNLKDTKEQSANIWVIYFKVRKIGSAKYQNQTNLAC